MSFKKNAFTLAEVLITLGIIGVVAAITIPTLVSKYQKQQYVTQLKKSYSQFNQVLKLMTADAGCSQDLRCTGMFSEDKTAETFGAEIVKYFNVAKDCGVAANGGCFSNDVAVNFDGTYRGNNMDVDGMYKFITADGTAFMIEHENQDCLDGSRTTSRLHYMDQYCGQVIIDVNGPESKPNAFGRDIFIFYITNGKGALLYPNSGQDSYIYWKDPDTGEQLYCGADETDKDGSYCAGRVFEEGWQMNY